MSLSIQLYLFVKNYINYRPFIIIMYINIIFSWALLCIVRSYHVSSNVIELEILSTKQCDDYTDVWHTNIYVLSTLCHCVTYFIIIYCYLSWYRLFTKFIILCKKVYELKCKNVCRCLNWNLKPKINQYSNSKVFLKLNLSVYVVLNLFNGRSTINYSRNIIVCYLK